MSTNASSFTKGYKENRCGCRRQLREFRSLPKRETSSASPIQNLNLQIRNYRSGSGTLALQYIVPSALLRLIAAWFLRSPVGRLHNCWQRCFGSGSGPKSGFGPKKTC